MIGGKNRGGGGGGGGGGVLSVDPDYYNCPRCGTRLSEDFVMDFCSDDLGKMIASCPNCSFKTHLEISMYGLIPDGYLHNIEKGILDRSEGWYEKWNLKKTESLWLLKLLKKKK